MNTFAYDKNLPCLNPQCKSHGRPHPNCRCYGFSDGGEVGSYCSESRAHKEDCEYFSSGGEVVPKFDEMVSEDKVPKFDEMKSEIPKFDEMGSVGVMPDTPQISLSKEFSGGAEQLKAGAEGLAQGLIGDLAKVVQVKTGISKLEDIERREKEFPVTHAVGKGTGFAGALVAPLGPARLITAKFGSKILGNVIASSAYALSDNTAKAFLGQPGGDVGSVVAGTILRGGLEGMMNTITGGLFAAAPKAAKAVLNEKTVKMAENFMIDLAEKPVTKALTYLAAKNVGGAGVISDIGEYTAMKGWAKPWIEKTIGKPLSKANAYVGDAVLNALAKTDFVGVPAAIRFAERAASGLNSVSKPVEALFKGGTHIAFDEIQKDIGGQIEDWMEQGGIDGEILRSQQESPEGFAKGGEVSINDRAFERLYPAENVMLNQARGRVSGYLNSIRPSKVQSKLPFDMDRSQKQKEKAYKKAVRFAANPLSVMQDINSGELTPENLGHFKSMWPEVYEHLSKKITERIVGAQLRGERPPYKKRQAMSLFLGSDLDSSFTPQSIAIVQGMYAAKKNQRNQAVQGSKKAVAKSSNQYLTDEQARERRMQNQKS